MFMEKGIQIRIRIQNPLPPALSHSTKLATKWRLRQSKPPVALLKRLQNPSRRCGRHLRVHGRDAHAGEFLELRTDTEFRGRIHYWIPPTVAVSCCGIEQRFYTSAMSPRSKLAERLPGSTTSSAATVARRRWTSCAALRRALRTARSWRGVLWRPGRRAPAAAWPPLRLTCAAAGCRGGRTPASRGGADTMTLDGIS